MLLSFRVRSEPVLVLSPEKALPGARMKLIALQNAFVLKLWAVNDKVTNFWS